MNSATMKVDIIVPHKSTKPEGASFPTIASPDSVENILEQERIEYLLHEKGAFSLLQKESSRDTTSGAIILPMEVLGIVMTFLDGQTLCPWSCASVSMFQMTKSQALWKTLCHRKWSSTCRAKLNQLPGAPDYDLIRLYNGSWKNYFLNNREKNQRLEISMDIENFANRGSDRLISNTFSIGEHKFCLWVFPRGNPHESEYAGRALSVYLVLDEIDTRPAGWLTCAVFTLNVGNFQSPSKSLEWNSCLADNRFDQHLFNWGVHSLGTLEDLTDAKNGFLHAPNDTLKLTAHIRLMTISFRLIRESNFKAHSGFGLATLTEGIQFQMPFCCSITELLEKLAEFNLQSREIRVWCFNQPVASGQSLRPRKLLFHNNNDTSTTSQSSRVPMFGSSLLDGVDIDAYSFCQIYVEDLVHDDPPLELKCHQSEKEEVLTDNLGYIFVKALDPKTQTLGYVGRITYSDVLTVKDLYEIAATSLDCTADDLIMTKELMSPNLSEEVIPNTSKLLKQAMVFVADIVIFEMKQRNKMVPSVQQALLNQLYQEARSFQSRRSKTLTLSEVEDLGEKLDIPKFRIRSAFRKCSEDAEKTLRYVMEGRHLGFICDSCGETDFQGVRYNCKTCSDYDQCGVCEAKSQQVSHRYANIEGKWQRLYDFTDHNCMHEMNKILPVFYKHTTSSS